MQCNSLLKEQPLFLWGPLAGRVFAASLARLVVWRSLLSRLDHSISSWLATSSSYVYVYHTGYVDHVTTMTSFLLSIYAKRDFKISTLSKRREKKMTTLRPFCCDDLFHYNNVNLDPLTETYNLAFYLMYLTRWGQPNSREITRPLTPCMCVLCVCVCVQVARVHTGGGIS